MSVWYDYYDFGTSAWIEGSNPICNVPPGMLENTCSVTTPLSLGGMGSGTLTSVPYLRLKGTDPDGKRQTLTKTLPYTFNHFEGQTETNVKVKITALEVLISKMGASAGTCYLDFCCGASGTALDAANAAKSAAEASLKACDLSAAYTGAANSINNLNAASVASDPACVSAVAAANAAASHIASVKSKIAAETTCDVNSASDKLSGAEARLSEALAMLKAGDIAQASSLASGADNSATGAEAAIKCAAPPAGTGVTPPNPPTSIPPASQPPSAPATSGQASSSGSACPLGMAILLGCLLATWRQKVQ